MEEILGLGVWIACTGLTSASWEIGLDVLLPGVLYKCFGGKRVLVSSDSVASFTTPQGTEVAGTVLNERCYSGEE